MFSFLPRNATLMIRLDTPTVTLLTRALDIWEGKKLIETATASLNQSNQEVADALAAVKNNLKK